MRGLLGSRPGSHHRSDGRRLSPGAGAWSASIPATPVSTARFANSSPPWTNRECLYRIIPGVTAAFAAAAALGLEYTLPEICQTLILTRAAGRTPVPPDENLAALASHKASLAIYLSVGQAGGRGPGPGTGLRPGRTGGRGLTGPVGPMKRS